jgi:NADPH:quinone reductase-like Zn-dependent oxidoreductase
MRAVVVHRAGGPEVLQIEERPIPKPKSGWVLVRVHAFGLNHSELVTRAGGSGDAVAFPRVLGIEAVGEVVEDPSGKHAPGQTFVAAMGEMGRKYDGGYEEYALLPIAQVIPVRTKLDWAELGAVPETFATAWGSLDKLALPEGASLLVRGGSSSVGMATITLAKARNVVVIATTRQDKKRPALEKAGVDHVLIDRGRIAGEVRQLFPNGVDGLLELVGPATMIDSLEAVRRGGCSCLTGYLESVFDADQAKEAAARLGIDRRRYSSGVVNADSYGTVMQDIVDVVQERRLNVNLDRTFRLDEISEAHRYMEANRASGKVVVLTGAH